MDTLEKLIRSLEFKIKHVVQFDIDWMVKTNDETSGVYIKEEIHFALGKKKGLLLAIETTREEIENLKHQQVFDSFISNSNDILDKLHKLIDDKQPESNTTVAKV